MNRTVSDSCETSLKKMCKGIMKALEEESPEEFLEGVLDIKRVQVLMGEGWVTVDYIFLVAWGGPNIEVNGYEDAVIGRWGNYNVRMPFTPEAERKYEEIREYLDEIYE